MLIKDFLQFILIATSLGTNAVIVMRVQIGTWKTDLTPHENSVGPDQSAYLCNLVKTFYYLFMYSPVSNYSLREADTLGSPLVYKGHKLSDFLFALLHTKFF